MSMAVRAMVVVSLLFTLWPTPARAQTFAGAYAGAQLSVSLDADPQDANRYTGTITLGDRRMPARGTYDRDKGFSGTFEADGKQYAFTLRRDGDGLVLTSDGATYTMTRQAAAPAPVARDGFIGLAARAEEDGRIVVKGVLAGGPAERAGVRAGDVVLEYDGKPLTGDAFLATGLRGPVGSTAKLLLGRGNEKIAVNVVRGPAPDAPRPDNAAPAPAADAFPAFLKSGARITWQAGSSSLAGTHLVPDDNGWILVNGKKHSPRQNNQSGGVGYTQLNLVHVSPAFVGADVRNYLNVDLQTDTHVVGDGSALTGDANALGEYWVHPARLAALPVGRAEDGSTVVRGPYTIGGRTYNAVVHTYAVPGKYSSYTYDLETGLMLSGNTAHMDPRVVIVNDRGVVQENQRGAATMSHARFVGVRQTNVPWANDPAPQWATAGRRLNFEGGQSLVTGATGLPPLPPQPLSMWVTFDRAVDGCVTGTMTVHQPLGNGIPPLEKTYARCYGSAMFGGLWVSPAALGKLQPNQVLDEDRLTRVRTTFAGVQGGVAVVAEQGPRDLLEYFYDPQSGALVGSRATRQDPGAGTRRTEFRTTGMR